MHEKTGWIGVDLDGTLAWYDSWKGPEHIGPPIQAMVERVKQWVAEGRDVRIFTARAAGRAGVPHEVAVTLIQNWCRKHVGCALPVTNKKDFEMIELWDDRCVQLISNTGVRADGQRG